MEKIIYGIIILSFISCSGYTKKDGKIYLKSANESMIGVKYIEVKNADYNSFKLIKNDIDLNLALDKSHVFIDASVLNYADPKSFKQINEYYWKDKNYVYLLQFGRTDTRIVGANVKSFKSFKNTLWSIDNKYVYFEFDKLSKSTPTKFIALSENWGKDNKYFYYKNLRIDSLEYKTAEIVNTYFMKEPASHSSYIKDRKHVFYQNELLEDANPLTFRANGDGSFGHDDQYIFEGSKNSGKITLQYRKTYIDEN